MNPSSPNVPPRLSLSMTAWSKPRRFGPATCWADARRARTLGVDEQALSALLRDVASGDAPPEHIYKEDGRSYVRRIRHGGRSWVVKTYHGSPLRTYCEHRVRLSIAWREWAAARRLTAIGVRTIQPLALLHRGPPVHCEQTLVMPHVEGPDLARWLRDESRAARGRPATPSLRDRTEHARDRHAGVAEAIGRQLGRLTAAGLVNRDHKASNLLIDAHCLTGGQPVVIDPSGLRKRRGEKRVWRMLALLWKTARGAGDVLPHQELLCLRAVLRADPTLTLTRGRGRRRRIEYVMRKISEAER